jgi:hypothetical protein
VTSHHFSSFVLSAKHCNRFVCYLACFTTVATLCYWFVPSKEPNAAYDWRLSLYATPVLCSRKHLFAQTLSRRTLTAKARVQSQSIPLGINCGQSSVVTGFSPSTSVFPPQNHPSKVPSSFIYVFLQEPSRFVVVLTKISFNQNTTILSKM